MGRTKIICQQCGKEFEPKSGHLKQLTCSKECGYTRRKGMSNSKKGKTYLHLHKKTDGKCIICGKEYKKKRLESKYCSKECWSRRNPPSKKTCPTCKKEFQTYERKKVYCSQKCRDEDYKKIMKGENSHFWKGGKTPNNKLMRSSAEFKEWREAVFKRDEYTCQACGKQGVVLHPHHIKHLATHPHLAYEVSNGLTLCKDCHQEEHKKLKLSINK